MALGKEKTLELERGITLYRLCGELAEEEAMDQSQDQLHNQ
jgi:hypothetical protein